MGHLEVQIRHGHSDGPGMAGLAVPAAIAVAAAVAAEVIVSVIWWLVTATAVLAVAVIAGAVVLRGATRRGEARFAAELAARHAAAIPAPERRALPPAVSYHLHVHGTDPEATARAVRDALPRDTAGGAR
jgi:hypothetical protein